MTSPLDKSRSGIQGGQLQLSICPDALDSQIPNQPNCQGIEAGIHFKRNFRLYSLLLRGEHQVHDASKGETSWRGEVIGHLALWRNPAGALQWQQRAGLGITLQEERRPHLQLKVHTSHLLTVRRQKGFFVGVDVDVSSRVATLGSAQDPLERGEAEPDTQVRIGTVVGYNIDGTTIQDGLEALHAELKSLQTRSGEKKREEANLEKLKNAITAIRAGDSMGEVLARFPELEPILIENFAAEMRPILEEQMRPLGTDPAAEALRQKLEAMLAILDKAAEENEFRTLAAIMGSEKADWIAAATPFFDALNHPTAPLEPSVREKFLAKIQELQAAQQAKVDTFKPAPGKKPLQQEIDEKTAEIFAAEEEALRSQGAAALANTTADLVHVFRSGQLVEGARTASEGEGKKATTLGMVPELLLHFNHAEWVESGSEREAIWKELLSGAASAALLAGGVLAHRRDLIYPGTSLGVATLNEIPYAAGRGRARKNLVRFSLAATTATGLSLAALFRPGSEGRRFLFMAGATFGSGGLLYFVGPRTPEPGVYE